MLFQISSTSSMRSVTGRALKLKVIVFIWTAYNKSELTDKVSRPPKVGRLDCTVRFHFLSVMALMPFIVNFFEYKGDLK